ncbi:MAG: L-histidine N(alpha)-methyltransferase [Bacteroidales bacterium]|nr:L-histidine N(alpha)-methyltransferase [Bacteroidales bacterium]
MNPSPNPEALFSSGGQHKKKALSSQFAKDVIHGFSRHPKAVSSQYFYDKPGDKIFQQIMNMPEYYLTRSEHEILSRQRKDICTAFNAFDEAFNLIEFGAGDGYKTKLLLSFLLESGADFTYYPVDISQHILDELSKSLQNEIPGLRVKPLNLEYFSALSKLSEMSKRRNVVLFLGSNIGNFSYNSAGGFLRRLSWYCKKDDMLLLGVDLKKDPKIITRAYDDPHGITAAFNLNLLERMNRELGADFVLSGFTHHTFYEPLSGKVLSYLVSLKQQTVSFSFLDWEVDFDEFELVHTEISKKYSIPELEILAQQQGFQVLKHFTDEKKYFLDTLWKVK